jgi:hypothetical protein
MRAIPFRMDIPCRICGVTQRREQQKGIPPLSLHRDSIFICIQLGIPQIIIHTNYSCLFFTK